MAARRKERRANAEMEEFEQDVKDVLFDDERILVDPGKNGEYAGFFPARHPWIEIDPNTSDVIFSEKLRKELSFFPDDFLRRDFDLAEHNGQRCIFFNFQTKKDFIHFTTNCTIPLRRLYGRATEGVCGSWIKADLLNIINWFNYPVELDEFHTRRLGDLRKMLDKHFQSFLNNIRVIHVDRPRHGANLRIEFSRDISIDELHTIEAKPYRGGDPVSVSGLWYNKLYKCRYCASTNHHHKACVKAKSVYQTLYTNQVWRQADLSALAKEVGSSECCLGSFLPGGKPNRTKDKCQFITFCFHSKEALLEKRSHNLSLVKKFAKPKNGCKIWTIGDLPGLCQTCGRRKTSTDCHCESLNILQKGLKIKDQLQLQVQASGNQAGAPPRQFGPLPQHNPSGNDASLSAPVSDVKMAEPPPPPPKAVKGLPPKKPPDPGIVGIGLDASLTPKLSDVQTKKQFAHYLTWHGMEFTKNGVTKSVTKKALSELSSISGWQRYHNHSEIVFGDVDNYKGLGYSYGSPLRFHKAQRWTPALSELSSEISLLFPDIKAPLNLTAVQRYEDGQYCNRHRDREPECKDTGFTILVALGPREFCFANKQNKDSEYVESGPFKMNTGDVMYISRELNYGESSCFHFKKPAKGTHYTIVLKSAKPPSHV